MVTQRSPNVLFISPLRWMPVVAGNLAKAKLICSCSDHCTGKAVLSIATLIGLISRHDENQWHLVRVIFTTL